MELTVGTRYNVTVINIVKVGAIVELEDKTTALIHISKISREFVSDPRDFIQVRGEYEAIAVAGKTKPVELSLLHLNLKKQEELQPPPVPATRPAKKEFSHRRTPRPNYSTYEGPNAATGTKSLEDMIAESSKALKDKIGKDKYNNRSRKNRGSRK